MKLVAVACLIAAAAGAGAWLVASEKLGAREAWDHAAYYYTVLPALAVITGVLGFLLRRAPVALGLSTGLGQAIAMLAGGLGSLWPIGLATMAVLSIPSIASAWLGVRLRGRRTDPQAV